MAWATTNGLNQYSPVTGDAATKIEENWTKLGIRHAEVQNVVNHGATGDGSTDDTTAIQAALTAGAGSAVYVPAGTYIISDTLLISANTRLTLHPDATIFLAANSSTYMLRDAEGQEADSPNIIVEGGTWDSNGLNQAPSQITGTRTTGVDGTTQIHSAGSWMSHALWFSRANRIIVRDMKIKNVPKWALLLSDCDDYVVNNITFDTLSDGIHIHGPSARGEIRNLKGTTGDDMAGLTINDYANYATSIGNIVDTVIDGMHGNEAAAGVRLSGDATGEFSDIIVRNITGSWVNHAFKITDDSGGGGVLVGAAYKRVAVDGVNATLSSSNPVTYVGASGGGDITLKNIKTDSPQSSIFQLGAPTEDFAVTIDGVEYYPTGTNNAHAIQIDGAATDFVLNNVRGVLPGTGSIVRVTSTGSVDHISGTNINGRLATGSLFYNDGTINGQLNNVRQTGGAQGFRNSGGTMNLRVSGLRQHDVTYSVSSGAGSAIVYANGYERTGTGNVTSYETATAAVGKLVVEPQWTVIRKTYSDFSNAANTNNVELFSLPRGGVIHEVRIRHKQSFTGGAIASYTLSVGRSGDSVKYAPAFDIFQAVGTTVQQYTTDKPNVETSNAVTSIRAYLVATGANLNAATQGAVDIWVLTSIAAPTS